MPLGSLIEMGRGDDPFNATNKHGAGKGEKKKTFEAKKRVLGPELPERKSRNTIVDDIWGG